MISSRNYHRIGFSPISSIIFRTLRLLFHVQFEEVVEQFLETVERSDAVTHTKISSPIKVALLGLQGLLRAPDDTCRNVSKQVLSGSLKRTHELREN